MRVIRGAALARETVLRRGPIEPDRVPPAVQETILRVFGAELDAGAVVDRILRDVREHGDQAVRRYNWELDRVRQNVPLEVSRVDIEAAYSDVAEDVVAALKTAADRIRDFHKRQLEHSLRSFEHDGVGQTVRPIERVGMYVPGTAITYPSTVLMTAIPARVAGVSDLFMATPCSEDGAVSPVKLVAADIAGVDRVFRAGGAQAIAALGYGTESIPAVHKICGPGNVFVTLAKQRLYGQVGIDGIFGPSETLVVADASAAPDLVASDLLAGAEHDELATAVLITNSGELAQEVVRRFESSLPKLARGEIARSSLEGRGGIVLVPSIEEAIELASAFAPEHLCLHVEDASLLMKDVKNAGAVFVGSHSVESIGDYTAGPSHVMPTGGSAAFASPLGVHDFLKVTSTIELYADSVRRIGPAAAAIARAEGLTGHARSIEARLEDAP